MSDVTTAVFQDQVADSLVSPIDQAYIPEAQSPNWDHRLSAMQNDIGDSLLGIEQAPAEEHQEQETDGPEQFAAEVADEAERQQILDDAEASISQQQQTQSAPEAPLTPEAIQQGIQALDQQIEHLGLNDQVAAQQFAIDVGVSPQDVNTQALGSTMAKLACSAVNIVAGGGSVGPIPPLAAQAFTSDFLRAFGIDARTTNVDSERFATVALQGAMQVVEALKTYGLEAPLDRINNPQMAEYFATAINQAFGFNAFADRRMALQLADAGAKYVREVVRKLASQQPANRGRAGNPQPRSQARPAGSRTQGNRSRAKFRTNNDIFSPEVLDRMALNRL